MYKDFGLKESTAAINEIAEETAKKFNDNNQRKIEEANAAGYERDLVVESNKFLRERAQTYHDALTEKLLSSALKGIYITALEQTTDMDADDYKLAESMVDKFIAENGTYAILRKMEGKTYLLDTIKEAVEDAVADAEEKADDSDKDLEEVPAEVKDDMFDKLEKEEDVNDAIQVISNRIAAAEEEFIKKNAEDKQKIEDIVNDINDRIQAVKDDVTKDEETKEDIEEGYKIETNRKVNHIYENRSHTLFDHMVHETAMGISKDTTLKDIYSESGKIDIAKVVKSCKCMYGFLEFVNTIQLDKVNVDYINKVVKDME